MGLETWFYNPPLPPFHEIAPPEELVRGVLLSLDGKTSLVDGVEIYFRHPAANRDGSFDPFVRGRVTGRDFGNDATLSLVARNHRGGTTSMAPKWAEVIPAELVDAGVLGPEYVLDFDLPGSCTRCDAPIQRRSKDGQCADKDACAARCAAVVSRELREEWGRFVAKMETPSIWITDAEKRAVRWAAAEINREARP